MLELKISKLVGSWIQLYICILFVYANTAQPKFSHEEGNKVAGFFLPIWLRIRPYTRNSVCYYSDS